METVVATDRVARLKAVADANYVALVDDLAGGNNPHDERIKTVLMESGRNYEMLEYDVGIAQWKARAEADQQAAAGMQAEIDAARANAEKLEKEWHQKRAELQQEIHTSAIPAGQAKGIFEGLVEKQRQLRLSARKTLRELEGKQFWASTPATAATATAVKTEDPDDAAEVALMAEAVVLD